MGSNDNGKILSLSLLTLPGFGIFADGGVSWPVKCIGFVYLQDLRLDFLSARDLKAFSRALFQQIVTSVDRKS